MADQPIKKEYINNKEFYALLCNALPYFRANKSWGQYDKKIGTFIMQMIERIKNKYNFKKYNGYHWEYMKEKALLNVFTYIDRYDLTRTNPFAYFTTIITNAYRSALQDMNEAPTEITYDGEIISEMMDEKLYVAFEDFVIADLDKQNLKIRAKLHITDEDMLKFVEEHMPKVDKEY